MLLCRTTEKPRIDCSPVPTAVGRTEENYQSPSRWLTSARTVAATC
jgi:hypothetical protein